MANIEEKLDKIYASLFGLVSEVRDNMVTKTEFEESKSAIITHVDGFIKLHETLDTEIAALRSKTERLEGWIKIVAEKTGTKLPT